MMHNIFKWGWKSFQNDRGIEIDREREPAMLVINNFWHQPNPKAFGEETDEVKTVIQIKFPTTRNQHSEQIAVGQHRQGKMSRNTKPFQAFCNLFQYQAVCSQNVRSSYPKTNARITYTLNFGFVNGRFFQRLLLDWFMLAEEKIYIL